MRSAMRAVWRRWAITTVVRPAGDTVRRRGHAGLGGEVKVGGRLVQEQDRRVDELRPGERDQLALAGGEGTAPLGDGGPVAVRELGDELVGADGHGRGLDLGIARVGAPVGDVVADRAREQEALLGHVAELAAVGGQVIVAKVGAVDEDGSCRRVVEAGEQLDDGRLPAPVSPTSATNSPGAISMSMPRERLDRLGARAPVAFPGLPVG